MSTKTNKFNIQWQIVRTHVRTIKDIDRKIKYVLNFLNKNKNIHNYGRVLNWLNMTGVAYKGDARDKFVDAANGIKDNKSKYGSLKDIDGDLSKISKDDLEKVYKDLSKRKYGFQYKSIPKAHTDFMDKLKDALNEHEYADPKKRIAAHSRLKRKHKQSGNERLAKMYDTKIKHDSNKSG